MTKEIKLKAELRKEEEKNLKEKGFVPGVVYGSDIKENIIIKLAKNDLEKAYNQAGESNLIDLEVEGKDSFKIIIKDVQKDAVKDYILHVDFYKVDMTQKIKTEIPLKFVGESEAVKILGGVLVTSLDSIEGECLPGDLVSEIEVDLSKLKTFDDLIRIKDLKTPESLEIINDLDAIVVGISEPREEVEETEEEVTTEATNGEENDESVEDVDSKKEEPKKE